MLSRRRFLDLTLAVPLSALATRAAFAGSPAIFSIGKVAINGYDAVSYFAEGRAIEGSRACQVMWLGAIWRFANLANLAAFEMNPRRFAPRYGGYCAYWMAKGEVVPTVPDAWTIYNGALYLNQSAAKRDLWRQDIPALVSAANRHWPDALDD